MSSGDIKSGRPNSGDIMESINRGSMPPSSPLSADQKALLSKWISQGAKNNGCTSACDTSSVKYSAQVKTIIDVNCKGCHSGSSPQGSIDLSTYELVKAKVTANLLYESISHTGGVSPMPKGGSKLSDCQIRAVKIWIDAGALNN
jgi:mono/diheme cytochrome c family protein